MFRKLFLIITPIVSVLSLLLTVILGASNNDNLINHRLSDVLLSVLQYAVCTIILWTVLMAYIYGSLRHSKYNIPIIALSALILAFACASILNFDIRIRLPYPKLILMLILIGINLFYFLHFLEKNIKTISDIFKLIFVTSLVLGILSLIFNLIIQDAVGVIVFIMSIVIYIVVLNQVLGTRKKPGPELSNEKNIVFQPEEIADNNPDTGF